MARRKKPQKRPKERAPTRVSTRRAEGRERLFTASKEPLWARLALDAIARHRAAKEPLERCLDRVFRSARAGSAERRAARDAAFAWARARPRLEAAVDEALARFGGIPPPRRDRDRAALVLAAIASGLASDDSGPLPEPLAALVEQAHEEGAAAVLGPAPSPVPAWLAAAISRAFGERAPALLESLGEKAPLVLALDLRHVSKKAVLEALARLDVRAEPSPIVEGAVRVYGRVPLARLPEAIRPHVWPMDDGSQAVVRALDVQPGERVLDLCAGGGGKSRLLSTLGAQVVATDLAPKRLDAVRARSDASPVLADGRAPPFCPETFDRVLVDAPCTGTGTLRRSPDLAARLTERDVERFLPLQRALLASAASLTRPGGVVVYATCSLLPEENEQVVEAVLKDHPELEPEPLPPPLSAPWGSLLPSEHGTDGFFLARLRRRG